MATKMHYLFHKISLTKYPIPANISKPFFDPFSLDPEQINFLCRTSSSIPTIHSFHRFIFQKTK